MPLKCEGNAVASSSKAGLIRRTTGRRHAARDTHKIQVSPNDTQDMDRAGYRNWKVKGGFSSHESP